MEGLQAASASDYAIAQVTQHDDTQFRQQLTDVINAVRCANFMPQVSTLYSKSKVRGSSPDKARVLFLGKTHYSHSFLTKCLEATCFGLTTHLDRVIMLLEIYPVL